MVTALEGTPMSERTTRLAGLYGSAAAIAMIVFSPLLALAYLWTADGAEDVVGIVAAWANPARDVLEPLLTWASPDRVYATYLLAVALCFPAVVVAAIITRRQRPQPQRAAERWGWRIAVTGYVLAALGVLAIAVALIPRPAENPAVDVMFFALLIPGMLLSLIGSTILGIGLLRGRFEPKATAWLLAFALPLGVLGSVLGHNSLGLIPLLVAWGITARRWISQPDEAPARDLVPSS